MDEAVDSAGPDTIHRATGPCGIETAYAAGPSNPWQLSVNLGAERLGVVVACTAGAPDADEITTALGTGGPPAALRALPTGTGAAVCAVIDRAAARISLDRRGGALPVLVKPDAAVRVLDATPRHAGDSRGSDLPPAATVLLTVPPVEGVIAALEECAMLRLREAADAITERLATAWAATGAVAVLYRQPPAPMELTLIADPANLAIVRTRLRQWLALTGVDPESSADILLAVGEATANSVEHSVINAPHTVEMTVRASLAEGRLRFTVADNGSWKDPPASPGHRGHGIRLIRALVDTADLTVTANGTTIEMLKEMSP